MKNQFSRRNFLYCAAAASFGIAGGVAAAPPQSSLRPVLRGSDLFKRAVPSLDQLINEAQLTGNISFVVADAGTGEVLESVQADIARPPASVTKALTALYALDVLGPEHRFQTRLLATGGVQNGEIQGDLILVGGGDPVLDTDTLATMIAQMKEAGISGVKGDFKVFEAGFPVLPSIDPQQPEQVGYNPGVSGLALNFNRVHFEWRRANGDYTVTMEARSEKYRPAVRVAAMQIRDRSSPIYTYENSGGKDQWTVARGALGRNGARWLPVRKPGLYAGEVFQSLAGSYGIRLSAPSLIDVLPQGDVVVVHESPTLIEIARDMLKFSTNLTAEMIGLAATTARGRQVAGLRESAAAMNVWARAKLGMQNPAFVDHSGLGDASRVTAQDMVTALSAAQQVGLRGILKTMPNRAEKHMISPEHPVRVEAKTGTLNFVSALAGYVTGPDGREMVFAIIAADVARRATLTKAEREGPPGGKVWSRRARRLQQQLLERWGILYATA